MNEYKWNYNVWDIVIYAHPHFRRKSKRWIIEWTVVSRYFWVWYKIQEEQETIYEYDIIWYEDEVLKWCKPTVEGKEFWKKIILTDTWILEVKGWETIYSPKKILATHVDMFAVKIRDWMNKWLVDIWYDDVHPFEYTLKLVQVWSVMEYKLYDMEGYLWSYMIDLSNLKHWTDLDFKQQ